MMGSQPYKFLMVVTLTFLLVLCWFVRSPGSYLISRTERASTEVVKNFDERQQFIRRVANDIEKLKNQYPQLSEFSSTRHLKLPDLKISFAYHTHRAEKPGGWTGSVPNPDPDGIWFYVDIHRPDSTAQIHTQPVTEQLCFQTERVSFLILEGKDTKPVSEQIRKILGRHGAKRCGR